MRRLLTVWLLIGLLAIAFTAPVRRRHREYAERHARFPQQRHGHVVDGHARGRARLQAAAVGVPVEDGDRAERVDGLKQP